MIYKIIISIFIGLYILGYNTLIIYSIINHYIINKLFDNQYINDYLIPYIISTLVFQLPKIIILLFNITLTNCNNIIKNINAHLLCLIIEIIIIIFGFFVIVVKIDDLKNIQNDLIQYIVILIFINNFIFTIIFTILVILYCNCKFLHYDQQYQDY